MSAKTRHRSATRAATRCRLLLTVAALAAGCAGAHPFVYQPSAAPAAGSPLPLKVAVLPFQDGTEGFEKRGSYFKADTLWFNLARSGISATIEPVTPPLWARAFAAELSASGRFRAARFAFDASELVDEDYVVEGTVLKAYVSGTLEIQYEQALHAVRRRDGRTVWERTVFRSQKSDPNLYDGCGMSVDCMNGRAHAELNRAVRDMYAEAAADLAQSLGGPVPRGGPAPRGAASPGTQDSVEDTIKRIMEGR